jgi:hypothetical protein
MMLAMLWMVIAMPASTGRAVALRTPAMEATGHAVMGLGMTVMTLAML